MKSFKQYIIEARPKGQKRYQREISKLETRLDKLYSAGGSQKKIDRAEMRLARKTNEGDYGVEDEPLKKIKSTDTHLSDEENPRAMSLEELMREKARLMKTHGYDHSEVGAEIRSGMNDMLHIPHNIQQGVSDEDIGKEAHKMLMKHDELLGKLRKKKN